MLSRRALLSARIVPASCLVFAIALAPGLAGCGPASSSGPRMIEDPPPPPPDELSSDNMPDPRMIRALHDEASKTP